MTSTHPSAASRVPPCGYSLLSPRWPDTGLTSGEVAARIEVGAVNRAAPQTSQSWGQIVRRNALNRLNLLLVALGGATLATGSAPDATFLAIAVVNSVVGATEEMRAKRALDALALINQPRARVLRDGEVQEVALEEVVVDDLLDLRPGDQLPADAEVVADHGEVDESLATGESDPVLKGPGDMLLSGSWVVAGALRARVLRVGSESYANRLVEEARRFSLASSELMAGINQILHVLSWIMVILAPVLLLRQLQVQTWRPAVRASVAGLVGMIPEGLVLLTTLAFLTAAVRLGRRGVLVQELPAVETLARVDAVCMDKTGTLTEGRISFAGLHVAGAARSEVESALCGLASGRGANATMLAIRDAVACGDGWQAAAEIPFSSARKWSAAAFPGHGSWVLGAPEMVDATDPDGLRPRAAALAERGSRVLVVARGTQPLDRERLPAGLTLVGVVELREHARREAERTLAYFARQQVQVRIISGDNPRTVRALAERVGLPGAALAVDARSLPGAGDPAFASAVSRNRVFGRVTPEQKREMVQALQGESHTVAMTGDGVNDVLALKDADLGIAVGSGSAVVRGVAQLVLLHDDFDVLPSVVAEGRRVLANIERVASLFLVKNVYSLLISLTVSVTGWPYPFLPRHLTLISGAAIGIPGFFLALAPNDRRFASGFVRRALVFSVVAGTVSSAAIMLCYAVARDQGLSGDASRTAAIIVTAIVSLWILVIASRPTTGWRALLILAMAALLAGAFITPGVDTFFSLDHKPPVETVVEAVALGAAASTAIHLLTRSTRIRRLTGFE